MKKMIIIVCVLGALSLLMQFFVQIFIKQHNVVYSIITDDNSYMINESFNVNDREHVYSFKVTDDATGKFYSFAFAHDYNKQDSVIEDIKLYNYNDLSCLFPIYKKGYSNDLVCNYKGMQVSNSYLKQIDNKDFSKLVSKLKKEGYNSDTWNDETSPEQYDKYKIYKENIPDDIVFTMWFYKGFYRIQKGEIEEKNYLSGDRYENDRSYLVGKHFISINTDTNTNMYIDFYIFNIVNGGKRRIDFENDQQVSENMYFNGVYKDKLYYTDLDKKVQYSLEPKYGTIEEVGNIKDGFKKVSDNSLVTVPAKEFLEKKVYFEKTIVNTKLEELYGAKEIKKDQKGIYYFYSEDGNFYKVNITDIKHPVLLFKFDSISEWKVKQGNVMIVSKDMMYFYNDEVGLLPILQNSELNYNYKNICNFAVK